MNTIKIRQDFFIYITKKTLIFKFEKLLIIVSLLNK